MATAGAVLGVIRAARPTLKNGEQRVAFAVHAVLLASGYSLTAVGSRAAASGSASQDEAEVGIEGWDDMDGAYTFRYSGGGQPELAKSAVVRCVSMDDLVMVEAAPLSETDAEGSSEVLNLGIKVSDYALDTDSGNYQKQYKNLDGLISLINKEIVSKLSPPPHQTSPAPAMARQVDPASDTRRASFGSVLEDGPQSGPGYVGPPIPAYGGSDLFPGAGAGVFPRRDIGGVPDGGMLVGPSDPRWGRGMGIGGDQGFHGGAPGVPPGARFDPYGPPGVPGFEPNRFARDQRGPPGRGDVHPDLQHFHPF